MKQLASMKMKRPPVMEEAHQLVVKVQRHLKVQGQVKMALRTIALWMTPHRWKVVREGTCSWPKSQKTR